MKKRIPDQVRAAAHVMVDEGKSEREVGRTLGIAKSSVGRVLRENTENYQGYIDQRKEEHVKLWADKALRALRITELADKRLLKELEVDEIDLEALARLKNAGITVARATLDAAIAQDKVLLLTGEPTARVDVIQKTIQELTPSERAERINGLIGRVEGLERN